MTRIVVVIGVALAPAFAFAFAFACIGPGFAQTTAADGRFGSPFRFTEQGGEEIYRAVCAGCHMADGRGAGGAGAYPSLVADPRLAQAAYAIGIVLHGSRAMPPFGRTLTDPQIADVVAYLRTHFDNAYPEQPTASDVHAAR